MLPRKIIPFIIIIVAQILFFRETALAFLFQSDLQGTSSCASTTSAMSSRTKAGRLGPPPSESKSSLQSLSVKIRIVGRKNSIKWMEEGYDVYQKRLRPARVEVETDWHKTNDELIKFVNADVRLGRVVVMLDPTGQPLSSEGFSAKLYSWLEAGGSRLSFVIGGAEGLPAELRSLASSNNNQNNSAMISLSQLTFTHQFARLLLIEQIYRASEIRKGSDYHK